jgi:hypothetical protein
MLSLLLAGQDAVWLHCDGVSKLSMICILKQIEMEFISIT